MQGLASLDERLGSKVMPVEDGCWLWTAGLDSKGYGQYRVGPRMMRSHRVVYKTIKNKITKNTIINHLYHIPSYINPTHLKPMSQQENVLRGKIGQKTRCSEGHSLEDAYIYNAPSGGKHRRCKECTKRWAREAYHRNKE